MVMHPHHIFWKKTLCLAAVFSMLFSGFAPATYAQEPVAVSAPEPPPDAVDGSPAPVSQEVVDTPAASIGTVERPSYFQSPAKSTNLVVEPNQALGSLTMRYPFQLPPGRNGFTPEITLVYSSEDHKNDSLVGYGWSLSIPRIYRLNKYGVNHLYQTGKEVFASSIDGELIPIALTDGTHGEYRAELEDGSFRVYTFNINNSWSMRDKSATLYQFGLTQAARLNNPFVSFNGDPMAYTWSLEKTQDMNGNSVDYEYDWFVLPKKISYGANATVSQPHIFSIEFSYEARTDILDQYYAGFRVPSDKRISYITIKKGIDTWRSYRLGYALGDNKARSMLASITETATDADGVSKTFSPTTFTYQKSAPGWERNQGLGYASYLISTMMPRSMAKVPNWAPYYVDVNGDAYPEAFYTQQCYPGTCSGFKGLAWNVSDRYDNPPMSYDQGNTPAELFYRDGGENWHDYGWQVVDLTSDGIPEMIRSYQQSANIPLERGTYTFNKNDTRWSPLAAWDMPYPLTLGTADGSTRIFDYNADGLPDMIYATTYGEKKGPAYDNTGTGWFQSHDVVQGNEPDGLFFTESFPQPVLGKEIKEDAAFRIGDANGDGLPDGVRLRADGSDYVSVNTGGLFKPGGGFNIPSKLYFADPKIYCRGACSASSTDSGTRLFDLNADGIVDIVRSGREYVGEAIADRKEVYIGTGSGWLRAPEWETPSGGIPKLFTESAGNNFVTGAVRTVDVNADGMIDVIDIQDTSTSNEGYLNTSKPADYMTSATFSEGGSSTFAYKPSSHYHDASNPDNSSNILNPDLPLVIQTLERVVTDDGLGNTNSITYEYAGGHYYFNNPRDRKFAGFAKVTETDQVRARATVHYFHQGNGVDASTGETADSKGRIGKEYRTDGMNTAGQLLTRTHTNWDETMLSNGRIFTRAASKVDSAFNPSDSSMHKDKALSYVYDTATGNITTEIQWGEVNADILTDAFTDTGSDKRTIDYTYAVGADNLIGLASTKTLRDFSGAKVAENRTYYDGLALGQAAKGNATKSEDWLDTGNRYIATTRTYNTLGLMSSEINPRGAVTQSVYDAEGLYPTQVTNDKNQTISYTYDPRFGAVVLEIDPNGVKSETTYDGLGRVKSKSASSPATGVLTLLETHTYDDASMPRVHTTTAYGPSGARVSYEYSNGRGAQVQTRMQADVLPSEASIYPSGKFAVNSMVYDGAGRVTKSYVPSASASSAYAATTQPDTQATITTYDVLDRPTSVQKSIGGFSKSYGPWTETTTDARGNQLTHTFDAFGNLVRVVEPVGTTQYAYDALGRLTNITDAEGNIRAISYDSLGRMTRSELAHKVSAPEVPAYSFEYDDAGNRTKQTYPDGKSVVSTYDSLNRVLTQDNPATSATTETVYVYDTALRGIGKLASVTTKDMKRMYEYDKRGNIAKYTRTIEEAFSLAPSPTVPAAPQNIEASALSDTEIRVLWTAPANDGGSPIIRYHVSATASTTVTVNTQDDSTAITLSSLSANTHYTITVKAENSIGLSSASDAVIVRTHPSAPSPSTDTNIYIDAFAPEWKATKINLLVLNPSSTKLRGNGTFVLEASYKNGGTIRVTSQKAVTRADALVFRFATADTALRPGNVRINSFGPNASGKTVRLRSITLKAAIGNNIMFSPNTWYDITIPFASLTSTLNKTISRLDIKVGHPKQDMFFDDIVFTNTTTALLADMPPSIETDLDSDADTAPSEYQLPLISATYEPRTFSTEYAYADTGHLLSTKYPDAKVASYTYGPSHQIRGVYVDGVKKSEIYYGTNDKPVLMDNGLVSTFVYDPDKQYLLSSRATSDGSVNSSYSYDAVANITRILDTGTALPKDATFEYDAVNRLTKSTITALTAPVITTYTYSPTGNITSKSDVGAYEYTDPRHPHAVTKAGASVFTYDKNGNLVSEGSITYAYDYANRLSTITNTSGVSTYIYDDSTNRIQKRLANGGRLSYVGNELEVDEAGKHTDYVFANNDRILTIDPAEGLLYNIEDHLSSASLIIKAGATPTIIQKLDYYPYGTERINEKTGTFSAQHTFTDKEKDAESGLQCFGARYYNSVIGRFTSVDPVMLAVGDKDFEEKYDRKLQFHLSNPQNLNNYSYVINNPLRYTDENGEIIPLFAVAYGTFEIGSTLYDSYTALTTWLNKDSSPTDKVLSTGSVIIGLYSVGPGNAYKEAGEWAAKSIGKADDVAKISQKYNWGNPKTLLQHFKDHGKDFGAKAPADYARKASEFFQNAQKNGFETLFDTKENTIRVYDKVTNTLGAFRPGGETRSFFKPSSPNYWSKNKGNWGNQIKNIAK